MYLDWEIRVSEDVGVICECSIVQTQSAMNVFYCLEKYINTLVKSSVYRAIFVGQPKSDFNNN